jgi:hypothetical protein
MNDEFDFRAACKNGTDLEKIKYYADNYSTQQLGQMFGWHQDTIKLDLRKLGMTAARFCHQCNENRPAREFDNDNRSRCFRHENLSGKKRGKNETTYEIVEKKAVEEQSIISCWLANAEMNGYAGCLGKLQLD